ncbi:MAG: beta-N-acetylhexosaminidase [Pseudomonadota bacterium]
MGGPVAAILGCEGPRLSPAERQFFAQAQPWGFILFARNMQNPEQVKRLTDAMRETVGRDAPILIDQEGGRVQRMGPPHWRQWLPPLDQMALAGPEAMALRYRLIAAELRAAGIDVNCAPCCDVANHDSHAFIKNRCYGTRAETVIEAATAVAEGLLQGGVVPVMKHVPGHGRAIVDSHFSLPRVGESLDVLRETDFAPFAHLAHLPMAMTAHVIYAALDQDRPATTSPVVLRYIREALGFGGLLITDDISMEALSGSLAERTADALAAGCDLVLHCAGHLDEMEAVVDAAGALAPEAVLRGEAALAARRRPEPIDIAQTEAKLDALLNGEVHG